MALLSIIVPVYNKENYIDDCVQAILNQTFTDFELILVNDGSTDGSGCKCEQYAQQDKRIMAINQPNGGPSAARNTGVERATGTYIGFIDSDDTIAPDMFELLVNNAVNFNADISVCRLQVIFPNGKVLKPQEQPGPVALNHTQALDLCLQGELDRSANNKIYHAAIAKQIKWEGHIYEDILYTCKAFLLAQKTVFENVVKYNYEVRENSASMSAFNPKYLETIEVSNQMVKLVAQKDEASLLNAQVFDIVANISLLNLLLLAPQKMYEESYNRVIDTLRGYKTFIREKSGLRKKHKYACNVFFLSPRLYKWLMYTYCTLTQTEVIKRTKQAS